MKFKTKAKSKSIDSHTHISNAAQLHPYLKKLDTEVYQLLQYIPETTHTDEVFEVYFFDDKINM